MKESTRSAQGHTSNHKHEDTHILNNKLQLHDVFFATNRVTLNNLKSQ